MSNDETYFDAKTAIGESLELIDEESKTSFYAQGNIGDINPGLCIEGVGSIGLPISEHDVQRLISTSHQAPFGKGRETFVDTSVRKTWEIDSDRMRLNHPKWTVQLEAIVDDVKAAWYREKITSTEKSDGMFGTLAVCLSSKHTGGDVELSFQGQKKVLSTSAASEWSVSYLSWYSDVLHEVKPVSSGYRVVLTFNLIQTGGNSLDRLSASRDQTASLRSALIQWGNCSDPSFLICPLEHQYTDHSLALSRLKGKDWARVHSVASLMEETKTVCYLASVEKEVTGSVDEYGYNPYGYSGTHEIVDEIDSSLKLTRGVSLDGTEKFRELLVKEEDFIHDDVFDDEPDDENFSGFTGNEGAETTHWYRKTAMVILPRDYQIDLLVKQFMPRSTRVPFTAPEYERPTKQLHKFIAELQAAYESQPTNTESKQDLHRLCEVVTMENAICKETRHLRQARRYDDIFPFSDETMGVIAKICLSSDALPMFQSAVAAVEEHVPHEAISEMTKQFGRFSFEQLRGCIDAIAQSFQEPTNRLKVCDEISSAFQNHPPAEQDEASRWRLSQADFLLCNSRKVKREDAATLVAAVLKRDDANWLLQKVVPFLSEQTGNSAFTLAFATGLHSATQPVTFLQGTFSIAFADLWEPIIKGLNLPREPLPKRPTYLSPTFVHHYFPKLPDPHQNSYLQPDDLIGLLRMLLEINRPAEETLFIQRLQEEAACVCLDYMPTLIIPFLHGTLKLLKDKNISLGNVAYQQLFVKVLSDSITRFVNVEPIHPTDWSKQERGCGSCGDCPKLDAFLRCPTQKVEQFKMAEKRRTHIESRLGRYEYSASPEFSMTTERNKSPYTLVVTKSRKDGETELREWRKRASEAKKNIATIGSEQDLHGILGDQFDGIVNLGLVTRSGPFGRDAGTAKQPTHGREPMRPITNASAAGQTGTGKRKAPEAQEHTARRSKTTEVIDLT